MAFFRGAAQFSEATFQRDAWFFLSQFHGDAWFREATFHGDAQFREATFHEDAQFHGVNFQGRVSFGAQVLRLDDPHLNKRREWPEGCIVRPDPADPTRGTLVSMKQAEEPRLAFPPPDPTS